MLAPPTASRRGAPQRGLTDSGCRDLCRAGPAERCSHVNAAAASADQFEADDAADDQGEEQGPAPMPTQKARP